MRTGPMLLVLALQTAGCARMVPEQVADGVARLTVRDLGGVLIAANFDEACGFANQDVIDSPAVSGELGEIGTATWTIEDCTIDLGPEPVELSTDCNGVITSASGLVTVTARKIVTGHFTGDPATPVIPVEQQAATFIVDNASFTDFVVMKTNSENHMRIIDGSLEGKIIPRLAADHENGACSVISPHIAFEDIEWGPSTVEVTSGKKSFEVPIRSGSLNAVNGTVGELENHIEGTVTVWNKARDVLLSGPVEGLDPDYDATILDDSFTCREELAQPVTFSCELDPILAENAARLIVKNFGLVSKTVDLDTDCGFGNLMGQVSELISLGALAGLFTGDPETIELDADACTVGGDMFPIFSDCVGTDYYLDGTATVDGTKTVTGKVVLSTNPLQPEDRHSALVVLDRVALSEVTPIEHPSGTPDYEPRLTMHGGTLSGTYHPVTGESADDRGAYFIVIPVGEFENIRLQNADVTLYNGDMTFPMHVEDSSLYAFTGGHLDEANWLYGTVTINGSTWEIGASAEPILLDPDYDQAYFDTTYECIEDLESPVPVN
ncbi:MAG: hypothetical protein KC912_08530 [Proteobacteria bacterium]|nr:hypothetical protein [Pseudomonadota bacterium]